MEVSQPATHVKLRTPSTQIIKISMPGHTIHNTSRQQQTFPDIQSVYILEKKKAHMAWHILIDHPCQYASHKSNHPWRTAVRIMSQQRQIKVPTLPIWAFQPNVSYLVVFFYNKSVNNTFCHVFISQRHGYAGTDCPCQLLAFNIKLPMSRGACLHPCMSIMHCRPHIMNYSIYQ